MINVDELSKAITESLTTYAEEVTKVVKNAVDETAKEVKEEIKAHITFEQPTGEYVKSFAVKTTKEEQFNRTKTWYVKSPHYRLTHLLEKSHVTRSGGRTKAHPHIVYGQLLAEKNLVKKIEDGINGL